MVAAITHFATRRGARNFRSLPMGTLLGHFGAAARPRRGSGANCAHLCLIPTSLTKRFLATQACEFDYSGTQACKALRWAACMIAFKFCVACRASKMSFKHCCGQGGGLQDHSDQLQPGAVAFGVWLKPVQRLCLTLLPSCVTA